jgi:MaoC dehydratase-like protein
MPEEFIDFELPVTEEAVKEFAAAVGADGDTGSAPPTFTTRQIFPVPRDEREQRLGANLDYARVLHGEQEFVYNRLPRVGETLKGRMRISKDFEKEGKRGGSMRFVTYESVFKDAEDQEVLTAYYTLLQTSKDAAS